MTSPYATGTVTEFPLSGNNTIDAFINWGFKWGAGGVGVGATVTYSFPQAGAEWIGDYYDGEPFNGFQAFNAGQQQAARNALALWQEVANITFVEVAETPTVGLVEGNVGDIRFGFSAVVTNDPYAIAWGYFPYSNPGFEFPEAGDVWLDPAYGPNLQMQPGQFGFSTLIHEIGHAIGLDHPFDDGGAEPVLPASMDNNQYTIMAYDPHPTASVEAMSPMLLDILAIQHLYGANMTTRTGNDNYTFSNATEELRAIWDAGGVDTFDCSNQTLAVKIDLNEGAFSSIGRRNAGGAASNNIAIAYGAAIENATGGSGSDTITGNLLANSLLGNLGNDTLSGGGGNDMLDGGSGNDKMLGGSGNDLYFVNATGDTIDEQGNTDTGDQVFSSIAVNLTTLGKGAIENAILTTNAAVGITGNNSNNFLAGGEGANTITGAGGDDFVFGLGGNDNLSDTSGSNYFDGGSGNDIMTGGSGTDAMYGGLGNDVMDSGGGASNYLDGGEGNDKLTGGSGNDTLLGGLGVDTLDGGAGSDFLDGGAGDDVMTGGQGADIYVVDSAGDQVVETGTDGPDEIRTIFNVDLGSFAGGKFEHTRLLGSADLNATGNSAFNLLWGNNGVNVLTGLGGGDLLDAGLGADLMKGGSGNDIYVVENAGDVVDEESNNDSSDTVMGLFSFDLNTYANGKIENAILLGPASLDAIGTDGVNQLIGGAGRNMLRGEGGDDTLVGNAGDDALLGGKGNDILLGGLDNDILMGEEGNDYIDGGAGNDSLKGDDGNDTIIAGAGDDFIQGGVGADKLLGGSGNDIYLLEDQLDTVSEEGNKDTGDEIVAAFSIALAAYDGGSIENVTLLGSANLDATGTSASNKLVGTSGVNTLLGLGGDDYLDGAAGADVLKGGSGNDIYIVDALDDTIDEEANTDTGDEIRTGAFSITLAAIAGGAIENATLLGGTDLDITGTSAANRLTGNSGTNTLFGDAGNDVLDGGAGDDVLKGGSGNDVYVIDSAGDVVDEEGNADAADEVRSDAFSLDLTSIGGGKIENATLLGGSALNLTGNAAVNLLIGNAAANVLDGGKGDDTLRGGAGNDIYIIDSAFEIVDEEVNTDTADEVQAAISVNLSTIGGGAVENATLLGSGNNSLYGNDLANVLKGNGGDNQIYGGKGDDLLIGAGGDDYLSGGAGGDQMKGGSGNDTYVIDSLQDTVDEEGNADTADAVSTSVDVDLTVLGGGAIENAAAYVGEGTTISLKGNDSNNVLSGNNYANLLDGGKGDDTLKGGGGADTLLGGEGNDTIEVQQSFSGVKVDGGAGTDTLRISGSSTLDLTALSNSAILGIERIDLTANGPQVLKASAQDVADLSSTSSTLFVVGDAGDTFLFTDAVTYNGVANVDGTDYKSYTYGTSTIYLDGDVGVTDTVAASPDLFLASLSDSIGFRVDGVNAGSMFGSMSAGIGDVNQDGYEDALFVGGTTAFLLYGQASTYDGPVSSRNPIGATIAELNISSGVSSTVSGSGDFNGDGIEDFAVGDWGKSFTAIGSGGAYIVYGTSSYLDQVSLGSLNSTASAAFAGAVFGEGASGYRGISAAGDLNGDGYDDQLMSAYGTGSGVTYVAFGRSDQPATIYASTLDGNDGFVFTGTSPQTSVGMTIAGQSDVNGDGYGDIVIGGNNGATVVFGHSGTFDADLRASELTGANGLTITGGNFTVGPGGDFNGDGYDDIIVADKTATAGGLSGAGYVYVIFGKGSGFSATLDVSQLNGANGFRLYGATKDNAGTSITLAGDYNGDGYDDLLIGAPGPFVNQGSAYLVYGHSGPSAAAINLSDLNGQNGVKIHGATSSSSAGASVAAADLNGDGLDDIIIGASGETNNGVTSGGAAYAIYGESLAGNTIAGSSAGETINGGNWADNIAAGQGNDIINGNGGADAINGGQGNDEIHVADNAFFRIDGGTGVDTLHLDYSGAIDFGNLDGNAATSDRNRIENVEVIDVANGHANALTLHLADVLDFDATITDVGGVAALDNALRIDGESGDTLQLFSADGWSAADTVTLAGYAIYTYQAVKVAVDTDIVVTVS
jgi:Ca2+-binding RTX toxin-like protein